MKASTRNRVMGRYHEKKGTLKAAIGSFLNSRRIAFAGQAERVGGKVQANFGRVEKVLGW